MLLLTSNIFSLRFCCPCVCVCVKLLRDFGDSHNDVNDTKEGANSEQVRCSSNEAPKTLGPCTPLHVPKSKDQLQQMEVEQLRK